MTAEEIFRGRLVMAPMTRGTDLPFRRLAAEWGATVCMGEMAYAHKVVRNEGNERTLLRRHPDEPVFGVQLAGKRPDVMADAAVIAEDAGADFVDVNLGCPIDDATRRGFGAALLERPSRVAAIVSAMKGRVRVPVTVKLRLGWSSERPTFLKIARAAEDAGADAVALHARSRSQRYRRPADWSRVRLLAETLRVPVIGNGDVGSWRAAIGRAEETGCHAVMVGRSGLTKPWLFREYADRRDLVLDTEERLTVLRRYVDLCREHFGDDEFGRRRTRRFLAFHQDFFRRYRPDGDDVDLDEDDPRDAAEPRSELDGWLARGDVDAVDRLCDWLVDGAAANPPAPAEPGAQRAVKTAAYG